MKYRFAFVAMAAVAAMCCLPNLAGAKEKKDKPASGPMLELFRKLDTEKDGKLSKSEFGKLSDVWKDKPDDLPSSDSLFKQLDANFDGNLTLDEFQKMDGVIKKLNKAKKKKA